MEYDKSTCYYAFVWHRQDAEMFAKYNLPRKPWEGYVPEEIGNSYEDLAHYCGNTSNNTKGGFAIRHDGSFEYYTQKELENDYEPRSWEIDPAADRADYEWSIADQKPGYERIIKNA